MTVDGALRRMCVGLALAAALAVLQGCTYLRHRAEDAKEVVDLGVTWSKKPCFSVYSCGLGLTSLGAGKLDGKFAGMGGGRLGVQRHYHKSLGLILWCYEEIGWGDYDLAKPETLNYWHIGPIGWAKYPQRRPSYAPA